MALMIVCSVTSSTTVSVSGLPGRLDQRATGLFGSASMIVTVAPFSASCVARRTAAVDLPTPPFGEAKAITGMASSLADTYQLGQSLDAI
jgi:hypothetical protein